MFALPDQKLAAFYKLAGQKNHGNYQIPACPTFLQEVLDTANADLVTTFGVQGSPALTVSHFQAYSGIKSLFRSTPREYLFRKGLWSVGLAICKPVLRKDRLAHDKAHREARDTRTIRERLEHQMKAVVTSGYKHFRFEYVLNMKLSGFIDHDRKAASVLLVGTSSL